MLALTLALVGCSGSTGDTGAFIEVADRRPAPVLRGESIYGKQLDTSAYAGSVLVLNVWGSWCAPCKKEQPDLEKAARVTKPLGVQFVGINVRDTSRVAPQRHVERYGVSYPSFHDPDSELVARFRAKAIPTTLVVDRAGRLAAQVFGEVRYDDLVALVREIAAKPRT